MGYNYENYGSFKESTGTPARRGERMTRALGLRNRYLRFLRGSDRNKPVVELGCGNGAFMRAMMDDGFLDVHGVEPSTTYQSVVPAELISHETASQYLESCGSETLGSIVALDVFEHIPAGELRKLLILMQAKLMPGGIVLFRVPNMASALGMANYFGDLSHVTPLNDVSIAQLVFQSGLAVRAVYPEPFAFPRSWATAGGILLWPVYRALTTAALAAFGIRGKVLTPNLICVLARP